MTPRPTLAGGAIAALFSALWALSYRAGMAEPAQFAAVAVLQGIIIAAFGWPLYRRLALPCLYLFLLVPTGAVLLGPLQRITAGIAALLLDLLRISHFHEDVLIDLPSGHYVVAPGCAGLNFLFAALAVSVAFADLAFLSRKRRVILVAAMAAMAVVSNGLRVGLIIAFAHWTDNYGDIVDDHLIYGWGFFTLLQALGLALGQKWSDREPGSAQAAIGLDDLGREKNAPWSPRALLAPFCLIPIPLATVLAPPSGAQWTGPLRPACGPFQVAAKILPPLREHRFDIEASLRCQTKEGALAITVGMLHRPLHEARLATLAQPIAQDPDDRLLSRSVRSEVLRYGQAPVEIEEWREMGRVYTVWTLFWADGAWRKPGWELIWADLASDIRQKRASGMVQLRLPGHAESVAPLLTQFLRETDLTAWMAREIETDKEAD